MATINITSQSGAVGNGDLQLQNGAPMDATLRLVTDALNTASPLKLSTALVQSTSTVKITTSDVAYIDAEDNSGNNRFTVSRASASQLVTVDFASVPTALTTPVGAIRTATDGVNLANVATFLENGKIGLGTDTPATKLEVNDSSGVVGTFKSSSYFGSIDLENTGGTVPAKWNVQSVSGAQVGGTAGDAFGIYSYAASAYRMFINSSGNVGIGTTSPAGTYGKLTVQGTGITLGADGLGKMEIGRYSSSVPNSYIKLGSNSDSLRITNSADQYDIVVIENNTTGEKLRLTFDGYLRLATGGIQFNGDTAAANALDDYEEGTWTPAITASVTAPTGVTYSFRGGTYTKIGNRVIANCGFYVSSVGAGGVGNLQISGLPFTTANYGSYQEPSTKVQGGGWLTASLAYSAYVYAVGSSNILEFRDGSNVDSPIPYAQLLIGTYLGLVIIYNVS